MGKESRVVELVRLGHRIARDKRITTHCCLVARAFGASKAFISGEEDKEIVRSLEKVVENWGGSFKVEHIENAKSFVRKKKDQGYKVVHLTVYGERIQDIIKDIKGERKILVLVGGEKVPSEFYELADYNVGITSQPHSEVAALGVFLHELFEGKELDKKFRGKIAVEPAKKGKNVKFAT